MNKMYFVTQMRTKNYSVNGQHTYGYVLQELDVDRYSQVPRSTLHTIGAGELHGQGHLYEAMRERGIEHFVELPTKFLTRREINKIFKNHRDVEEIL